MISTSWFFFFTLSLIPVTVFFLRCCTKLPYKCKNQWLTQWSYSSSHVIMTWLLLLFSNYDDDNRGAFLFSQNKKLSAWRLYFPTVARHNLNALEVKLIIYWKKFHTFYEISICNWYEIKRVPYTVKFNKNAFNAFSIKSLLKSLFVISFFPLLLPQMSQDQLCNLKT